MTTKLEIIGPYTQDHPGPFCTREGIPVEMRLRGERKGPYTEHGYIANTKGLESWNKEGSLWYSEESKRDLMNAREVRVPREVWVNEYTDGDYFIHDTKEDAEGSIIGHEQFIRTIHFREVVEGE